MVYKKIDEKMIERVVKRMKYYDEYRELPEDRIRIDITLPVDLVRKLRAERIRTKKPVSVIIEKSLTS